MTRNLLFALIFILLIASPILAGERMAALQETIVSIDETGGIPGVFTYDHQPGNWLMQVAVGKLKVGVTGSKETAWLSGAKDLRVQNIPGGEGVEARGTVNGIGVRVQVMPVTVKANALDWQGAALMAVTCSKDARLALEFGGIGQLRIFGFTKEAPWRGDFLRNSDLMMGHRVAAARSDMVDNNTFLLKSEDVPLTACVKFQSPVPVNLQDNKGIIRCETEPARTAWVMVTYGKDGGPKELLAGDLGERQNKCRDYFEKLTKGAWISTPSKELDQAFRASVINLEYSWVPPYGWVEAIHHWVTLYSQQQNLAADWIGQANRSRDMLLTHAVRLTPSGQVPQLDPSGMARVDFGGWNQFYVWGVQHYWRHTGDKEFLKQIQEPLGKVVDQTITAHDADGNGLLGFGQQIGNQEDYITTPQDGTSPTIAAIEMRKIQAEIAWALGQTGEVEQFEQSARKMSQTLRRELWQADLGRYPFYRDSLGKMHLDGQYHTLIWPVICNLLDPLDSYTSMRHLSDVLTGDQGQIFTSNNFPSHVTATVGSQAGGQQQPWATLGWANLGNAEKAVAPLEWIAHWVMNDVNKGSWCEVAESMPAYFSPPAGVYVQGVVEGIFGLNVDKPKGILRLSPCIPEKWPKAALHLPEHELTIVRSPGRLKIESHSTQPWQREWRVPILPGTGISVRANGRPVGFRVEPGVRRQFVCFSLPSAKSALVEISWKPVQIKISCPTHVSPGEQLDVPFYGAGVEKIADPCGVLSEWNMNKGSLHMRIRDGVASEAEFYGEQGRQTLSRRTIFVWVRPDGINGFWEPLDFSVVSSSRFIESPMLERQGTRFRLSFEMAVSKAVKAQVEFGNTHKAVTLQPRMLTTVNLVKQDLVGILPGINLLKVILPDGRSVEGKFDASLLFSVWEELRHLSVTRMQHIPLPNDLLSPDSDWRSWRWWSAYGHPPWNGLRAPLEGIDDKSDLSSSTCPGLTFVNPNRKVVVASRELSKPFITIPVGKKAKRVYLLILPLLDHQDIFSGGRKRTTRGFLGQQDGCFRGAS